MDAGDQQGPGAWACVVVWLQVGQALTKPLVSSSRVPPEAALDNLLGSLGTSWDRAGPGSQLKLSPPPPR